MTKKEAIKFLIDNEIIEKEEDLQKDVMSEDINNISDELESNFSLSVGLEDCTNGIDNYWTQAVHWSEKINKPIILSYNVKVRTIEDIIDEIIHYEKEAQELEAKLPKIS